MSIVGRNGKIPGAPWGSYTDEIGPDPRRRGYPHAPPPLKYLDARKLIDAALNAMTYEEIYALADRVRTKSAEAFAGDASGDAPK